MSAPISQRNSRGLAIFAYLFFFTGFSNSSLVVVPSDTSATEGSRVQLNCSTDLPVRVHWQHIPVGSILPTDVYLNGILVNGYQYRSQVMVDLKTGAYNLIITAVQLKDAGIFRCLDDQGGGEQRDALLRVTENMDLQLIPKSAEVEVGSRFEFTCKTYYKGEAIKWQRIPVGGNLPADVYISDQLVNGYGARYEVHEEKSTGTNKLLIRSVGLSDSGLFRCIDRAGAGQQVDAQLTVVERPQCQRSVGVSAEKEELENLTLTCSLPYSGNSVPQLEWIHNDTRMEGQELQFSPKRVTSIAVKQVERNCQTLLYICLSVTSKAACNITDSHNCTESGVTTAEPDLKPATTNSNVNLLYLLFLLLLLIPIIIVIVFCRQRTRRSTRRSPHNPAAIYHPPG